MPLSWVTKISYGFGHVMNDLCSSMWFSYLLIYFHSVNEMSNKVAGNLFLLGQIADGLSTPFVGIESDRTSGFRNYGRRKSWHLVGSLCVAISFPFIFNPVLGADLHTNDWIRFIYYAPFIVIFQFGWAATQISHLSLIPDITLNEGERVFLNSIRYFFTVFSNIVVYTAMTFLLLKLHHPEPPDRTIHSTVWSATPGPKPFKNVSDDEQSLSPQDMDTFRYLSFSVIALGLLFTLFFHIGVKEIRQIYQCEESSISQASCTQPENSLPSESTNTQDLAECALVHDRNHFEENTIEGDYSVSIPLLRSIQHVEMAWKDWFFEPQFYLVGCLYLATRVIVNVSQVYLTMYLTDALGLSKNSIGSVPLVSFGTSMVTSVLLKKLHYYLGRKINYFLGLLFLSGFCLCVWFNDDPVRMWLVYLSAVFLGIACSALLVGSLSIVADLIGNNNESSAFVYGSMSFADKVSNGVVVEVIQFAHPCTKCCVHCAAFYKYIEVFIPGAFGLLALLLLMALIPLNLGTRKKASKHLTTVNSTYNSIDA